ncbi:MAG: signal peptidase II [Pseudomonadota bacterium]
MSQRLRYIFLTLIPVIIILDQWTKYLVLSEPRFNALGCLDRTQRCGGFELSSVFDLTMVWNRGVSFGIGQSEGLMRWVLVVFTAAIALGFAVWLLKVTRNWTGFALSLIVGGAIGNVIDRARFGAVVDFFDFSGPWFGWQIPLPDTLRFLEYPFAAPHLRDGLLGVGFPYVFNIADAAISVGAVLLFIDQFLLSQDQTKTGSGGKDE